MTRIKQLMVENRWTARSLAIGLCCTRYLLKHIIEHEPKTDYQRRLAQKALIALKQSAKETTDPSQMETTRLPSYGEVPAFISGDGEHMASDAYVQIDDLDSRKYFALRVHGFSMAPTYLENDILICRRVSDFATHAVSKTSQPINRFLRYDGRVICVLIDGTETTLKRVEIAKLTENQSVVNLLPLNSNYPIIRIDANTLLSLRGDVVRIIRNV